MTKNEEISMKIIKLSVFVFVLLLNACTTKKQESKNNDSLTVETTFIGQKPPDLIPEPFAPGLVTTNGWENCGAFSPDMKEFYFLRQVGETNKKQELVVIQNKNNELLETVISPRAGTPFISPDGKTMYLGRRYKERTNNGEWSEVKKLESPFDSLPIMRLTASSKGTYFFDEFKRDFTGDIRYSRIVDGKYEEPKLLNKNINTGKSFHPFIAPDESYLIFDSKREGGYGDSDLYISFKQQDDSWGDPINLGDKINTEAWEASASVTPDGKYLFFNRNMGSDKYENVDIFWVSSQVIEELRPTNRENNDIQDKYHVLKGPYIGQKPPGLIPEVFAPGIVSKEHQDWTGRFTPDMKEYYFTRNNSVSRKSTKIVFKFENNRWSETELDPKMGGSISPDGQIMHAGNKYRERTENGWSELKSLGQPFEDIPIMVLTASSKGTYFFDEFKRDVTGDIRYSRLVDGKHEEPRLLNKSINSGKSFHPFIAPDESYLIFDSKREDGFGDSDLYISFRQQDGSWSDAINLGDKINTEGPDTGGVVSPDGKYFFFNRKISSEDSDVYWVDTQVLHMLRPKQ